MARLWTGTLVTPVVLASLISVAGVIISVCCSVFAAGIRFGKLEGKIDNMTRDVSEIRGMFTLTPRVPRNDQLPHGQSVTVRWLLHG